MLWEAFSLDPKVSPKAWCAKLLKARRFSPEHRVQVWLGPEGSCGLLSFWETGAEARENRGEFAASGAWSVLSEEVQAQPVVHLLVVRGEAWDAFGEEGTWVEMTRDVAGKANARGKLRRPPTPAREDLPEVAGAHVWPVQGHQGRLMFWASSGTQIPEEVWGDLCDPVRRWACTSWL